MIASSDAYYDAATYNTHGNTLTLGTGANTTNFNMDSSDRNTAIVEIRPTGNLYINYQRDVADRITRHQRVVIGDSNNATEYYGFTSSAGSPSFVVNTSGVTTQKYLSLHGGVMVTIRPQQAGANAQTTSLSNVHGDVFATLDATGTVLGTTQTGPFGETLPNQTLPLNGATGVSYGYVGKYLKATETQLTLKPMQMGARVYLPAIGMFTSKDPIPGGSANAYSYVLDPINSNDFSGRYGTITISGGGSLQGSSISIQGGTVTVQMLQPAAPVSFYQPTVAASRIVYTAASTWSIRWDGYGVRAHAKPAYNNSTAMGIASVQPFDFSTLKPEGKIGIPSKGASSFFTQIGIVGCYGGCIDIGVAFDDYSPHFTVSFGYGTEIGWSGYASTGPGRVRSGWNAGASCSCAIGYAGYTVDNYGTTPFAGANFPAATRFGCATMFGYTF